MVNGEAIAEIDRLVEKHLSVARTLQAARNLLAPTLTPTPVASIPAPTEQALSDVPTSSNSLVLQFQDRETRISALLPVEFRNMKYNDAVVAALQLWGREDPAPKRADILRIMKKGGFRHPRGFEVGAKDSIRNASASGKTVMRLSDDPDGEYGLREWFGNQVAVRPARKKSSQQKEATPDLFPAEEQQTEDAQAT